MALSQKSLQRKKIKKQKKRRQHNANIISKNVSPANWPIDKSLVHCQIWQEGIGTVAIVRQSAGRYMLGNYLIDVWGLGLKDAFVTLIEPERFQSVFEDQPMESQKPEYCKALILAACDFSRSNGLKPNMDKKASDFIANIPWNPQNFNFEFGKDGKVFYVSGPHDDEILPKMMQP